MEDTLLVEVLVGMQWLARLVQRRLGKGFVGGWVFAMGVGFALQAILQERLHLQENYIELSLLILVLFLLATLGDLIESIIKRELKVKDSGSWGYGMGGIIDLIDSLCVAAPVYYLYLIAKL